MLQVVGLDLPPQMPRRAQEEEHVDRSQRVIDRRHDQAVTREDGPGERERGVLRERDLVCWPVELEHRGARDGGVPRARSKDSRRISFFGRGMRPVLADIDPISMLRCSMSEILSVQ